MRLKYKGVLAAVVLSLSLTACGDAVRAPTTPKQTLVELRATHLATVGTFSLYASQQWCDAPGAPKPPLCASPAIVKAGARISHEVVSALSVADAIVNAGGVADDTFSEIRQRLENLKLLLKGQ